MSKASEKIISQVPKYKNLKIAMGIILCSLLPFAHDIITLPSSEIRSWLPKIGIVDLLTNSDGNVWGYMDYRVFLYIVGNQLFAFIAWFVAFYIAKGKSYRFALLIPLVLTGYQFFIAVFNLRLTKLNEWNYKIGIVLVLGIIVILNFFLKKNNQKKKQKPTKKQLPHNK